MKENSEYEKHKKKITLLIVLVAVLGVVLIGITYAFFSYVRTGEANTIRVGNITFNSEQTTITLSDVYPITSEEAETDTTNSDTITISVNGKTSYAKGLEYRISLTQVSNFVELGNDIKEIPIAYNATAEGVGTISSNYYTERGGNESLYIMSPFGNVSYDKTIMVGYISPGDTGIDGNINVKAYLDADELYISDTYDGTESDQMGTTNMQVANRTVITTEEWNSLKDRPVSFKVRIEAQEGVWVDDTPVTPELSCGLVSDLTDGYYMYDCGISNSVDFSGVTKYEIFEDNNGVKQLVSELNEDGTAGDSSFDITRITSISVEAGTEKTIFARAYIVNKEGEKVYSNYSQEVTFDWTTYKTPTISISKDDYTGEEKIWFDEENNVYKADLHANYSDYQMYSFGTMSDIQIVTDIDYFEKNGTEYNLVYEGSFGGEATLEIPIGEKKTFVAAVYALNSKGEKIYSGYSNEITIDKTN